MSADLRLVVLTTSLHGGGAEWVGLVWVRELLAQGHRVVVVTTSDKPTDQHLPAGAELVGLGHLPSHAAKVSRLRQLFQDVLPDVGIALQNYPNLLLVAAAALTPRTARPATIVSEHNLVTLGLPGSPPAHRVKHVLAQRAYRRADHVVAVSHAVAGELVGGFGVGAGRCTVIRNPAAAKVPAGPRPRRSAPDLDVDLVIAHRLVPQKRPLLALAAAEELARRGLRVRLTVFGTGPLQGELEAAAARSGVETDFRGWAEHWFDECSDKTVFLLASHREGLGNVLVEAAAAGLPSVALSAALGTADALVPGVTGELAIEDSPEGIADAVQQAARLVVDVPSIEPWLDHFREPATRASLNRAISAAMRGRAPL
ncbi:Glycosyltransferase involved in cell wall bisynthesis [Quadrisphaera granulorum]|uniref:Glycosyltransferase involved in cell wall biosynthesis n=1 Tax=Quadrisphaera granulorum TaxID=317664 RepID=A0A316AFP9_9ACTN|nr:glycosyltransferase [Quadrisphaera granulorum]PWJ48637.1 glycosyltransferase involved in cell wall biosynthesis [Quadrisphaera granulorum]SZE98359.1 Glycosyltransferase involved in cell wall bisynthesis [Quadrisphaera granulorum]